MGKLKVLPAQIANMIAAGEVVQRPASVVKELMENAVDAGASHVSVVVTDAGHTLIQVIDNGCGMSPSDAVLCFERHATSKIATADDLNGILTYGFRGEALASIAAVAEVTLKTRRAGDDTGTRVTVSGWNEVKSSSVAAPQGSNFEVRNLFYNTPARRKFLKSDSVELRHIIDAFTRVALTSPDIAFSLRSGDRDLFVLKAAKSLKFRILDLLGSNVVGDIVDLHAETSAVNVDGFVGSPESAKKALGNQYFFVNGRYFRSPYLHKAVMKAYEDFIPEGVTPSYFIWLQCDPHSVDVNISPTKSEVKFEEDTVIFQILYACIKETLGRNAFGGGIDFEAGAGIELPNIGKSYEAYKGSAGAPVPELDPDYDPFAVNSDFDRQSGNSAPQPEDAAQWHAPQWEGEKKQDYGKLFDSLRQESKVLIIKGKYLITPAASGIMAVNVRRARERLLYERTLKALSRNDHITQTALYPVQVQVGTSARLLFEENASTLEALGFDMAPFGTDTVVVNGVPEGFSCEEGKVQQMVQDLVLVLSEDSASLPERLQSSLAAKFATLGSMNSADITSPAEGQALIDTLFASENAEFTPGGRRIVAIIPMEDLDKRF